MGLFAIGKSKEWVTSERKHIRHMIHPLLAELSEEECSWLINGLCSLRREIKKKPHLNKDVLIMGLTILYDAHILEDADAPIN